MAIAITIVSTKGGVGKTTLTANLGGLLADLGQRVLLVDADAQPTLSSYYPITQMAEMGLTHLITQTEVEGTISQTNIERLDLIVSDDPEGRLRDWILHTPGGLVRLKYVLTKLNDLYDIILIDTQGAVGPLQDSAVLAADLLISPIPPQILSAREFTRGTVSMLERLRPMAHMGAPVPPLKGLIYRNDRSIDAKRIVQSLREESFLASKGSISILNTIIPETVAYREAATRRIPVHRWKSSVLDTLSALVQELFPHLTVDTEQFITANREPLNPPGRMAQ